MTFKVVVRVKGTNFLVVIFDENLNWKLKISHVVNKVVKSIGMIRVNAGFIFLRLFYVYCTIL